MDDETKYWIAFSVFPGIGPVRFNLLRRYFGSARKAWFAPISILKEIKLGDKLADQFDRFRNTFSIDGYIQKLLRNHITAITLSDTRYPALLSRISDAPFILYVKGKRGKIPIDLTRIIAVVGTRKATQYGIDVTKRLVAELVSFGCTIVSGMAYGIDQTAHETALEAGGQTIAVLGCGADVIAPPSNAGLYHEISEGGHGAIVSEMPLGLRPVKGLFIARNRIISGLSLGVLVTEGADDSGSLITAGCAGEQGRDVFAVPGPITSMYSKGPSFLLKNGAVLVENASDIIDALGLHRISKKKQDIQTARMTDTEQRVYQIIEGAPMHIDEIIRISGLTVQEVSSTITILEMKGIIRDCGERTYGI